MITLLRRLLSIFTPADRRDERNEAMHGFILQMIESDVAAQDRAMWSPLGPIGY